MAGKTKAQRAATKKTPTRRCSVALKRKVATDFLDSITFAGVIQAPSTKIIDCLDSDDECAGVKVKVRNDDARFMKIIYENLGGLEGEDLYVREVEGTTCWDQLLRDRLFCLPFVGTSWTLSGHLPDTFGHQVLEPSSGHIFLPANSGHFLDTFLTLARFCEGGFVC